MISHTLVWTRSSRMKRLTAFGRPGGRFAHVCMKRSTQKLKWTRLVWMCAMCVCVSQQCPMEFNNLPVCTMKRTKTNSTRYTISVLSDLSVSWVGGAAVLSGRRNQEKLLESQRSIGCVTCLWHFLPPSMHSFNRTNDTMHICRLTDLSLGTWIISISHLNVRQAFMRPIFIAHKIVQSSIRTSKRTNWTTIYSMFNDIMVDNMTNSFA